MSCREPAGRMRCLTRRIPMKRERTARRRTKKDCIRGSRYD